MTFKKDTMYRKRDYMLTGEKVLLVPYSAHHVDKYVFDNVFLAVASHGVLLIYVC